MVLVSGPFYSKLITLILIFSCLKLNLFIQNQFDMLVLYTAKTPTYYINLVIFTDMPSAPCQGLSIAMSDRNK